MRCRYKQSVLQFVPGYVEELLTSDNRPFIQYVADNVDHNVRTLDGRGTFHGMSVISVSTFPTGTFHIVSGHVLRTCKRLTALDVAKGKSVPLARYCPLCACIHLTPYMSPSSSHHHWQS